MANYIFYEDLRETCCASLYRYDMPVFMPSTSNTKAGKTKKQTGDVPNTKLKEKIILHTGSDRKDSVKMENIMSNMSLGLSLGLY